MCLFVFLYLNISHIHCLVLAHSFRKVHQCFSDFQKSFHRTFLHRYPRAEDSCWVRAVCTSPEISLLLFYLWQNWIKAIVIEQNNKFISVESHSRVSAAGFNSKRKTLVSSVPSPGGFLPFFTFPGLQCKTLGCFLFAQHFWWSTTQWDFPEWACGAQLFLLAVICKLKDSILSMAQGINGILRCTSFIYQGDNRVTSRLTW